MSKIKLSVIGIIIFTSLSLSFIYNRNKTIKVELTKYFESKEGYGNKVLWLDQDQWISAGRSILYRWNKDKLIETIELAGYHGESVVYNPIAHKLFAETYIYNTKDQKLEELPDLRNTFVEGMDSAPGPGSGYFDLRNMTWDKDGKTAFLYTRFYPSKALETTPYSGIQGRLLLIDPITGKLIKMLWETKNHAEDFQLAITDNYLIAAGGGILFFDKNSGQLVKEIDSNQYAIRSLAINNTGSVMAIGRSDGTLELFKINDGWKSAECMAHAKMINTLAFHPSIDLLMSGSEDKKMKIWETGSGKPVQVKEMTFDSIIEGVAFDKEGKRLSVSEKFSEEKMHQFHIRIK